METEYVVALIGIGGTVLGAILANLLSVRTASASELRLFLTDAYTQVTANYLLFIDGKATRSEIVSAIEKAMLLCSKDMEAVLRDLEKAVLVVRNVQSADLTRCGNCFSAFRRMERKCIDAMWKKWWRRLFTRKRASSISE